MNPCVPAEWREFSISYRARGTTYRIKVENPDGVESGVRSVEADGAPVAEGRILFDQFRGKSSVDVRVVMRR